MILNQTQLSIYTALVNFNAFIKSSMLNNYSVRTEFFFSVQVYALKTQRAVYYIMITWQALNN